MLKFLNAVVVGTGLLTATASITQAGPYDLGRPALPEEVAAWNIDVRPDGQGLPIGSGDAETGETIFAEQCASCHGDFGEGVDRWPVLAGGMGTLSSEDPVKTVGSFWPYLSTVYDYIKRAMPYGNAQSLSDDDIYAITAYILNMNDLVDYDFILSNENFTAVRLPNEANFIEDARPDTATLSQGEPCMTDCKGEVKIVSRARILDVTPEDAEQREARQAAQKQASAVETVQDTVPEDAGPAIDVAIAEAGGKLFKKRCASCHQMAEGKHKIGPSLYGVYGAEAAGADGFTKYSKAMKGSGLVWDEVTLDSFLHKPKTLVKGTRMAFAGLKKEDDRKAIIEYIKQMSSGM